MKRYNVYNYWNDIIGQVWGVNADDALERAHQEYGDFIYVLPVNAKVETK